MHFKFETLKQATEISDPMEALAYIDKHLTYPETYDYRSIYGCMDDMKDFVKALRSENLVSTPSSVFFEKGNTKLKFIAFSALPGKSYCPGAGSCLNFCYSFKSWRIPRAFFRQWQNSLLLSTEYGRTFIAKELDRILYKRKYRNSPHVDFRLYVDGDFRNVTEVKFWMDNIRKHTNLYTYGYSKSLEVLYEAYNSGVIFPSRYLLNLSSGSKHDTTLNKWSSIKNDEGNSIVRGRFIAIKTEAKRTGFERNKAEKKELYRKGKANGLNKTFVCPGLCHSCIKTKVQIDSNTHKFINKHACGSDKFRGRDIVIPIH